MKKLRQIMQLTPGHADSKWCSSGACDPSSEASLASGLGAGRSRLPSTWMSAWKQPLRDLQEIRAESPNPGEGRNIIFVEHESLAPLLHLQTSDDLMEVCGLGGAFTILAHPVLEVSPSPGPFEVSLLQWHNSSPYAFFLLSARELLVSQ